ncbi:MAG TPA: AMP-binding protein [Streptosporangiaceae bacterium]|nr:AMP-binding protein [Streptosporangiaceae bacterium]
MIHHSPLLDVEIPDLPLTEYVLAGGAGQRDKPALIDGASGWVMTYGELEDAIRSLAGGLAAAGFGRGDVLALMAPNGPEYAVVFHGAAMVGGAVTTINPAYTQAEVHHQLADSGARILVTIAPLADAAARACTGTAVTEVYLLDGADEADEADEAERTLPVRPLTALAGSPLAAHVPVGPDDVVALPYSSGTTGLSKGVMLTHKNLVANVAQTLGAIPAAPDERLMAVLPFFHIYGMQCMMNCGLRAGATVVTLPRFDLEQFLRAHQDYRITRSFVAPPIVLALARHPLVDSFDLSHLRLVNSGAAPLKAELAVECGKRLGCDVIQGYGMTELSPVSHLTPAGWFRPGSVGITAPSTQTRIVDPLTGADRDTGEEGEVWVRGPQVMKGYLNNPQATAATVDVDGWLHTGDLGYVDADGHVYVVDRLKELVKYKGFQVPPAELEAVLLRHPDVADAAVIGLPDDEAGEIPAGYVVLRPGAATSPEEITRFVAGEVAHYKQIRRLEVIDAIPKSAAGKILRRVLRDSART